MADPKAHPGTLHQFAPRLVAFEWAPPQSQASTASNDTVSTLLFVGGLFDDLLTVPLTALIAKNLPAEWRLMQARLSSSSLGWGVGSLDRDAEEMSQCITYIRSIRPKGKVVLMGHSTGANGALHYAASPPDPIGEPRAPVDGFVLQGPASDREGNPSEPEDLQEPVALAKQWVQRGDGEDILPKKLSGFLFPCSARRFLSLTSPGPEHSGQDDLFSSDLSDERLVQTFGKLGALKKPVQILFSGDDEYVPDEIDKEAHVARWHKIIKESGGLVHEQSGIVPGMDHNGSDASDEAKLNLVARVVAFLQGMK